MQNTEVSTFLDNDYADSALYISFRSMPNVMDGLKQSGRKVVYVCKKKALKEPQKVSNLAGAVIDASQYLHGNTSPEGVIVTLAQDYCGANNIPYVPPALGVPIHIRQAAAIFQSAVQPSR